MPAKVAGAHRKLALSIAAVVFVLDQLTKWIVTYPLQLQQVRTIEVLPIFRLHWTENRGVSMGLLTADAGWQRWLLVVFTAAIAAGVSYWLWREKNREDSIALGLILGGAIGNILDRARLGYVVDFADLHFGDISPFLVFNVGDAAITIGVLLLIVRALFTRESKPGRKSEDA